METTAISELNQALRSSVKKKWAKLKDNNAEIFRFDIDKVLIEPLKLEDLDKKVQNDGPEYFWIEYKEKNKKKKFAFFFKDVDTSTHNIHVVPGIFEEFEYRMGKQPPADRPYSCVENGKAIIKNVKDKGCLLFAEQVGGDEGWWVPATKEVTGDGGYKSILTKAEDPDNENSVDTIEDVFQKFEKFKKSEKKLQSVLLKS